MSKTNEILFAGFGGQGILFSGKVAAYSGLVAEKCVSWLPSYGPEMRGGTANCHVIVSDQPVGSPIIVNPTDLVVMNKPSFDKFENDVVPGGNIFIDSALIDRDCTRDDVNVFKVPATKMANDMGMPKLANMIMFGKLLKETGFVDMETVKQGLAKSVPPTKQQLFDTNLKAIEAGYNL
ncbi:MAG: 2-oxoacid:acceptor oxidoreductase family protein [Clostridia bacterium]|nr:2-oxoacid:acceptor oxidoreductase family protein [Clostridia bacterium]